MPRELSCLVHNVTIVPLPFITLDSPGNLTPNYKSLERIQRFEGRRQVCRLAQVCRITDEYAVLRLRLRMYAFRTLRPGGLSHGKG